jgi:hypothetical protein
MAGERSWNWLPSDASVGRARDPIDRITTLERATYKVLQDFTYTDLYYFETVAKAANSKKPRYL